MTAGVCVCVCVCLGHSCFPLRNYTTEFLGENVAIHYICLQQWMGKREIIFLFSFSFHFISILFSFFILLTFGRQSVAFFLSHAHSIYHPQIPHPPSRPPFFILTTVLPSINGQKSGEEKEDGESGRYGKNCEYIHPKPNIVRDENTQTHTHI